MNIKIILYGLIPAIMAIGSVAGSALVAWKARTSFHYCASVVVLAATYWALFNLYRAVFLDEWTTVVMLGREHWNLLPQFAIAGAFGIFAIQAFIYLENSKDGEKPKP